MNQMLLMTLLFLPVILVAITILTIQIRGDFFELKHRVKRQLKVSITVPLTSNHEGNVRTIEMIQDNSYKNIEIILLANNSQKKVLGKIKYYRQKNKLKNIHIMTSKVSKQRARNGNVQGRFVLHMPPGNHALAKNSLSLGVARLQVESKRQQSSVGIVLLPSLDNRLKSGLYFTYSVLVAHLARSYRFIPTSSIPAGIVARRGIAQNTRTIRLAHKSKFVVHLIRWTPFVWLVAWISLFGSYAVGAWAVVLGLLIILGFSAQLNLKNRPFRTRVSVILLTPLIVFMPIKRRIIL